ncbi:conserved protein of unknown function [Tenacibaculum sp. 190524A02b]|uniref:hypothetical protein n=1 Tax=Tenacibaculum vairaonense TaxID=3137860 RepID=UPI0032B263BE
MEVRGNSAVYSDFAGYIGTTVGKTTPQGKKTTLILTETASGEYIPSTGGQVTYRGGLSFGDGGPGIYSVNPNPAGSSYYGDLRFHTTYWNGSGYTNADRMVIKLNGNIGVGTVDPKKKLHINGTLGVSDHFTSYRPGSNTFLRFDNAGYTGIGSGSTLSSGANVLLYGKSSSRADVIAFRNSTGEKVMISKDGKVGIGLGTGLPASKLHVHYSSAVGEVSKNGIAVSRNTQTTGNVTSHDKGIYSGIGNFSIPAGVTDLGYKIGLDASSFASTTNFKGTLRSNYGIWARAGVHQATSGAKINYAAAIQAQVLDNIEGVTIENVYGIKISTNDYKKATVNNRYDIYAGTEAAKNYFAGKVGIGTTKIPTDYKLAVDGKIGAREIKVESRAWPDYVFTKDYNLLTLKEVENHIKEKGHLKDIPSAEEVKKNGFFLGEMDANLLQKIEELTLYTIQQEKQLKKQSEELNELKKLVQELVKTKK